MHRKSLIEEFRASLCIHKSRYLFTVIQVFVVLNFPSIMMRLDPNSPSSRVLKELHRATRNVCRVVKAHFAEHMTFYTRQLLLCIDRPKLPKHLRLTYIDQRERYSIELYYYSHKDCSIRLLLIRTKLVYGLVVEIVVFEDIFNGY